MRPPTLTIFFKIRGVSKKGTACKVSTVRVFNGFYGLFKASSAKLTLRSGYYKFNKYRNLIRAQQKDDY